MLGVQRVRIAIMFNYLICKKGFEFLFVRLYNISKNKPRQVFKT
jgi:hypothetical protein